MQAALRLVLVKLDHALLQGTGGFSRFTPRTPLLRGRLVEKNGNLATNGYQEKEKQLKAKWVCLFKGP